MSDTTIDDDFVSLEEAKAAANAADPYRDLDIAAIIAERDQRMKTRFDRLVRNGWSEEDAAAETGHNPKTNPGQGNQ